MRTHILRALLLALAVAGAPARAAGMGNDAPVVDSVTVSPSPVPAASSATITCSGHDPDGTIVAVRVIVSAGSLPNGTASELVAITAGASASGSIAWSTPAAGSYSVQCGVQDSGGMFGGALTTWLTVPVEVVAPVGSPPALEELTATAAEGVQGSVILLHARATDPDGDPLTYSWSVSAGTLAPFGADAELTLPYVLGPTTVTVSVSDPAGQTVTGSRTVEVRWALAGEQVGKGEAAFLPERVAVDLAGNVYVTSPRERAVVAYTALGARLRAIPVAGRPGGVAVGAGGLLYVANLDAGRVDRVDALGRVVGALGVGAGEFKAPLDLAVDAASGEVFVADGPAGLVKVYGAGGAVLRSFPVPGAFPSGIALSPAGTEVYVSDQAGGRVLVLSPTGLPLRTIGSFGADPGQLTRPVGLTLGPDGNLYVVDVFQARVVVFSAAGAFVAMLGGYGESGAPGQLQLPLDAAADPFGRLVLTSPGTGRVELFGLGGARAPVCAGDTDCDGMPDAWELRCGLDPRDPRDAFLDLDGDGLANALEHVHGTDPRRTDTDDDGSSDLQELLDGTDPLEGSDRGLVANAGPDQLSGPTRVTLDGSGSLYHGGAAPSFSWSQLAGPELVVLRADSARPSFVARLPGVFRFQLQVGDGTVPGPTDVVEVTIEDRAPVADAGPDLNGVPGRVVLLDGRFSSDASEQQLTYAWTQVEGPKVALGDATSATPWFVPAGAGVYAFSLQVRDPRGNGSAADLVYVAVDGPGERVPVAAAPAFVVAAVGERVALDGLGSADTDGDRLGYTWRQTGGPQAALDDAASAVAYFKAPVAGSYELELVVDDGKHRSVPQQVLVAVRDGATDASLADAGPDQRREVAEDVRLSCAASVAGGAGPFACSWRQVEGPELVLSPEGEQVRFVPLRSGTYVLELELSDGGGPGTRDRVTVVVDDPAGNVVPVAAVTVRPGGALRLGATAVLDGSESWDGDPIEQLYWSWTQILGPRTLLGDGHGRKLKVRPALPGFYGFELRVDDGVDRSPPARVELVVLP